MNSWLNLDGRVAVVSGAGGGIGRAITHALVEAGVRVAAVDAQPETLAQTVDGYGSDQIVTIQCDVTNPDSVKAAAATVKADLGDASIVVNNAGILRPGALADISIAAWRDMLAVNLDGYLLMAQAFVDQLKASNGGALVHISSIAASHPQPNSGAYSAGKAAVSMLSRQMAYEWGPDNIRSNVVSPGLVKTPMSAAFYEAPGVQAARENLVPSGRIAEPDDMANAVLFLASDRASYVNGQELVVDGGLSQTIMGSVPRPGFG